MYEHKLNLCMKNVNNICNVPRNNFLILILKSCKPEINRQTNLREIGKGQKLRIGIFDRKKYK